MMVRAYQLWFGSTVDLSIKGDAELVGPDYFMDKRVVVVTINYRLGALGKFLQISTFLKI